MCRPMDKYSNIAEAYDYMLIKNPEREAFFKQIFEQNRTRTLLDCACGTGKDLVLFASFGIEVTGSDISESMLNVARKRIAENGLQAPLYQADFQTLKNTFDQKFDAIVALSNAVNEIEVDIVKALVSMRSRLTDHGIIIFDQGQSDASMKNPPQYSVEVNNCDFSRLFSMNYRDDIMTVHIFDLIHTHESNDFKHNEFKIKIRLYDDWQKILDQADLKGEFYGDWSFSPYDKDSCQRLIVVARKR